MKAGSERSNMTVTGGAVLLCKENVGGGRYTQRSSTSKSPEQNATLNCGAQRSKYSDGMQQRSKLRIMECVATAKQWGLTSWCKGMAQRRR